MKSINARKTLRRLSVGGLPLIHTIARRLQLRELLGEAIDSHGNESIAAADTLVLLIYNLTLGKQPLYELSSWVDQLDGRCIGYTDLEQVRFTDDRFGRALDKLYQIDRACLMTRLVIKMIETFAVDLSQLHNDSTSVKAFGTIPGKTRTGVELKRGHSKDHRPDLKQVVFSLSISSDGAVPIHHKVYAGNRTDDTTHIETWTTLRALHSRADFLYVGDAKLCTDAQLHHIASRGGRAITSVPETWREVKRFKAALRQGKKAKSVIWRRPKPNGAEGEQEYFSCFSTREVTDKRRYRIHWLYSSSKRQRDGDERAQRLSKAEQALGALNAKLNRRRLRTVEQIKKAANEVLQSYQVSAFISVEVGQTEQVHTRQTGLGRPGKNTRFETVREIIYTLTWVRRKHVLQQEAKCDGVFPLLSTDDQLSAKEVLQAYKYQPKLEKRFMQFKSIHQAAPLLFKKVERVEANLFAFFVALMIQALLEREVRHAMVAADIPNLKLYPEQRPAVHPTTSKVLSAFEDLSTYQICARSRVVEQYQDGLNDTQKTILKLLKIPQRQYWAYNERRKI
jgi:transposase